MRRFSQNLILAIAAGATALLSLMPLPAVAHGERATEPYIRTRTVHWYDVIWTTNNLQVNETVTIEGKFRLLDDWPDAVTEPHLVFLSNATPGAVMTRVESYINDMPARQSLKDLVIGRDYSFKLVMKGRIPGRWHLHPVLSVHGAGAIVGPGAWVNVEGSAADYTESLTTLNGAVIEDMQTFGVARVQLIQFGFGILALAWLVWWLRRPLIIPRWNALAKGREDLMITRADDMVAAGTLVVVLLIIIVGYTVTLSQYPQLVPLQSGSNYTPPLALEPTPMELKLKRAEYDVPGRSMRLSIEMTNTSKLPISVGEFTTANLRFINKQVPAAVAGIDPRFPSELIPANGLVVDNNAPIAPGETRLVLLEASDAAWELERLVSFLSNIDSRTGGLIFFFDSNGKRYINEIYGPIIPVFRKPNDVVVSKAAAN